MRTPLSITEPKDAQPPGGTARPENRGRAEGTEADPVRPAEPFGANGSGSAGATRPEPSEAFLALVSHEYARRHLVLSAGVQEEQESGGGVELLLVSDQTKPSAAFNAGVRLGRPVRCETVAAETLAAEIDRAYARARREADGRPDDEETLRLVVSGAEDVEEEMAAAVREAERDLLETKGKAPAVRLVDLILFEAVQRNASDVHVQPLRDRTMVRYRLDGSLHTVRELPASLAAGVVGRIKVMASLDLAERRSPQDGRAAVSIGASAGAGRRVDLRVSTLPSTYGERVVLRLLDPSRSARLTDFAALGMPASIESAYLRHAARSSGIVLSTGPTGSGKTTTLYATLAWVSSSNTGAGAAGSARGCELNMMTVEDPVEYDLSAAGLSVSQTQVDPKRKLTFASGLRHILRQDPDVIMVGEIRDEETARIAVQASLTGHLVLSTLHTNDSASAVARLLDLGVEPFLVASSLSAVLAQRLIRELHPDCGGSGCEGCLDTGFKGRTGVFELLEVDHAIRDLIGQRSSSVQIKDAAKNAGMRTLAESGEELVRRGRTSKRELARVIDSVEEDWL